MIAGKWSLDIERVGSRYVVRLSNGFALSLCATKKYKDKLVEQVASGSFDEYIEKYCNGGK